ncbi:MAG: PD-(D/E)XK nuclease family protein [Anaerolineaceae bacterium]|jgi:CRISPR/Cas system-associated exonuclease Cas4 (RecB family)|nr:PD-(D/E)XK nuclease family protein [Anaerolineaceae bacterium]MDD4042052.1 PD-(D/E)XK nuclease family protein [Anaerolineaceae bacterium]MDD4578030.1 PD-(D/E)XK nuclease family protein [Anaerolineaceae bacterium]
MTDLISPDFTFSQSNLQTFDYCRRRFYLRYVKKLIWPAQLVSDQQYIQDREAGVRFHRLVHQHFLGFEASLLRKIADGDPDIRVATWFETFLASPMATLQGKLEPEALFTTKIAGHPLSAKVDLLQIDGENISIYDWKTSRHLPKLSTLQKQTQSKVYPLVISRALNLGQPGYETARLRMIYWEANFPGQTIEIPSYQNDWKKYQLEIAASIELILSLRREEFVATPDEKKCAWCEYRSYCQREKIAVDSKDIEMTDLLEGLTKIPAEAFDSWG